MKRIFIILGIALTVTTAAFSQKKMAGNTKVKDQIISLEREGWEAWKTHNAAWERAHTTEDFLYVNSEGVRNKDQVVSSISSGCNIKSYSLDGFQFVMLDEKAVMLTYVATEDGICGNVKMPSKMRVSVNYVRHKGKWMEAFYMASAVSM
jgi:hypothetical protein